MVNYFIEATIAQNTAVIKCCQPRTSYTAICAFRKASGPLSGLTYQALAIFLHFFLGKIEILFGLASGTSVVAQQHESLML